jgi:hypothetical protein
VTLGYWWLNIGNDYVPPQIGITARYPYLTDPKVFAVRVR